MQTQLKTILFPTNLSENCRQAFDYAAIMATRFQATLVLLHVVERIPDYVEDRLRGLLGENQWNQIQATKESEVQKSLTGKRSTNQLIKAALKQFCAQSGIDDDSCEYTSREIVITQGDVVDDIVDTADAYNCDMIIMGARKGLLGKTSMGPTIKSVIRRAKIPVLVVPASTGE